MIRDQTFQPTRCLRNFALTMPRWRKPKSVAYKLAFRPAPLTDLRKLHDYIADHADAAVAAAYVHRIEQACRKLTTFHERGTLRSELASGIRIIGFERRTSIAFRVEGDVVRILRFLHGGQNFPKEWDAE